MFRVALACLFGAPLVSAGHCAVGTTSVELVDQKGYNLTGQTHVITGGDSGIGLGIATALMEAGARVIFLAHDVDKTESLVQSMKEETGNANFRIIPCNLMSLNNTREAAEELKKEERIDAFIGDAGATMIPSFITEDGFECVFQLEYLSHFLLVQELLPKLRESHGRIVLTGSDGISPTDSIAGLCNQLDESMGCESLDRILDRTRRVVPPKQFVENNGNVFLGLYLRVLLARELALREQDIMAFSFHPGWANTPAVQDGFDKNAFEFFSIFLCGEMGLLLGALIGCALCCRGWGKRGRCSLCGYCTLAVTLLLLLGGFVGYLTAGPWAASAYCSMSPYYQCVCNNADGTEQTETCPISPFQGSLPGAYLAAASALELEPVNGAMTVVCGDHPDDTTFDPYTGLVQSIGDKATRSYLEALYEQSEAWIAEAGQGKPASIFAATAVHRRGVLHACAAAGLLASLSMTAVLLRSRHAVGSTDSSREALLTAAD